MCGKCGSPSSTNCCNDCTTAQPKTICDLTPSGDIYWDGEDLVIGETTIATNGDSLNDVLTNLVNEINNLHP